MYRGADEGSSVAMFNLAGLYLEGLGVEQNEEIFLSWLIKAAELDLRQAQVNLAAAHFNKNYGLGDYSEGLKWYLKAAEIGDPLAHANLGIVFAYGQGVEPNMNRAYYHLKASEILAGDLYREAGVLSSVIERLDKQNIAILDSYLEAHIDGLSKSKLQFPANPNILTKPVM